MLFGTWLSAQQSFDGIPGCEVFIEHAVDCVADRHLDFVMAGKRPHSGGGEDPFGNMAQLGKDQWQRFPSREREAHAAIARKVASASEHEVTQTGQTHQRFAPAAKRRG